VLATFPDPDPARRFTPECCVRAVLRGATRQIDVPREVGAKRGLLRRASFWDALMSAVSSGEVRYEGYSYRERADRYVVSSDGATRDQLRASARLVSYTTLRDQIRATAIDSIELFVTRHR
ncbi:MAG: hypothetical protein L0271_22920, partial [Gemmatimonadetes bacterium]|nr:hypothetical protein [Gemmatimonadota bacterium]